LVVDVVQVVAGRSYLENEGLRVIARAGDFSVIAGTAWEFGRMLFNATTTAVHVGMLPFAVIMGLFVFVPMCSASIMLYVLGIIFNACI
jgi:hypothetical protein